MPYVVAQKHTNGQYRNNHLTDLVAQYSGLPRKKAHELVKLIFHTIMTKAIEGKHVILPNFGSFFVYTRPSHMSRNPQLNTENVLASRKIFKFNPSRYLKTCVDPEYGVPRMVKHFTTYSFSTKGKMDTLLESLEIDPFENEEVSKNIIR